MDEVTLNDPAKELALHGRWRSSVFSPDYGFDQAYFWQPPGQPLVTALVYKIFGFNIWSTRVPGVVFGAGVLVLLYWLALALFHDRRAAFWAAILFGLDPQFILTVRSGRMDTQCLFLALLGVLFCLRAETSPATRSRWLLASGLAVGLAGITHPLAVMWALALGSLILVFHRGARFRSLVVFAFFAALPGLFWLAYALQTPQLFFNQFYYHGAGHLARGPLLLRPFEEIQHYLRPDYYLLVPFLLLAYFGSLFWIAFRAPRASTPRAKILLLFGIPFLFNCFLMTKTAGFYFLHPNLILAVSAGAWLSHLRPAGLKKPASAREWAVLIFFLLLAGNVLARGILGRYLTLAYQWQARDYARQVELPVRQFIPAGSLVWGPPQAWYAVEKAGASLRLLGRPNPQVHDYAMVKTKEVLELGSGFHKLGELGQPLPPLFGRVNLWSDDYQMQIWKSDLRPAPKPAH